MARVEFDLLVERPLPALSENRDAVTQGPMDRRDLAGSNGINTPDHLSSPEAQGIAQTWPKLTVFIWLVAHEPKKDHLSKNGKVVFVTEINSYYYLRPGRLFNELSFKGKLGAPRGGLLLNRKFPIRLVN
ncbi:hypothetical protein X474_16010 [Dethiosulfatarculus sandiegensis]|uniref:Uncharacterized protein n=1 Tax=Dethiosulfatarculus sandiegensis TaxID=1429043 RepID=A0A0D2HRB0_9BACT|nr:hypothetical protein X474_16010 [Dethiosulfatarculus sandiegensis]